MPITPLPRGVIDLDQSAPFQNAQQLFLRSEAEIALIDPTAPKKAASSGAASPGGGGSL